jgi:molybdopterin/thiamine biosynthesis adenylyltransferase
LLERRGGEVNHWRRLSRQIRILRRDGIEKILRTNIAITGLGSNGSALAFFSALAGLKNYILLDRQALSATDLNRFLCGGEKDIGKPKVDLVKRHILEIDSSSKVETVFADVRSAEGIAALEKVDAVFSAVDNNLARVFLQKFCLHRKPLLDIGSGCSIENGKLVLLASRASLYVPGGACLFCQTLDEEEPVLTHASLVIPNVIAAAQGLGLFLSWLTGCGEKHNFIFNDCLSHKSIGFKVERRKDCPCCGQDAGSIEEEGRSDATCAG